MPRVLHVLASNDRRGAELFAIDLAGALKPLGWESTLVSVCASTSAVTVPATPLGGRLTVGTLRRLRALSHRHDVVIAHGSKALPACAIACAGAAPFVYRSIGDPTYWSARGLQRRQTTLLLNRASTVVTLFSDAKATLQERGVRSALEIIPNAVVSGAFPGITPASRHAARRQAGVPQDGVVVLYLGALSPEKRPERAVTLAASRPEWTVLIVGDGPLRPALTARAAAIGNVALHGATQEPRRYLHAADVLILPSDTEGMPAVVIEAGLSSLPVVATDVGGLSSVIEHRTTCLLVPPGDGSALLAAVEEGLATKEALGSAARDRCLMYFDIEPVARRWSEVMEGVADT